MKTTKGSLCERLKIGQYDLSVAINYDFVTGWNSLPSLPDELAASCHVPPLRVGKGAKATLATHRTALGACKRRHGRTVRFYDRTREAYSRMP